MNRVELISIALVALLPPLSRASDAETSASAGRAGRGDGTATATARYEGDAGFARTDSRSGRVNVARGVAVGVDEGGLSLSISNAIATHTGLAVATNFNLGIGTDGRVSASSGIATARGAYESTAAAGGRVGTGHDGAPAGSTAHGRSDRFGRVTAHTQAAQSGPREVRRIRRW